MTANAMAAMNASRLSGSKGDENVHQQCCSAWDALMYCQAAFIIKQSFS